MTALRAAILSLLLVPPCLRANPNPALDILKIGGAVLAGVEAAHLLYLLATRPRARPPKEPDLVMRTNYFPPPPSPVTVPPPQPDPSTPPLDTDLIPLPVEPPVAIPPPPSEPGPQVPEPPSEPDFLGPDYYYLVALQYHRIGKPEKAKEYLFHSIRLGLLVEESKSYLREKFGLSDRDIERGLRRYRPPSR